MAARDGHSEAWARWQRERRESHLAFDVEAWYEWLKPITFATRFLPLSLAQAKAMLQLYQHRYVGRLPPSRQQLGELRRLETEVQRCIDELASEASDGVFVRLSTRSPKDAVAVTPECFERALQHVKAEVGMSGDGSPAFTTNCQMVAISDCMSQLSVSTGEEALQLFSSSERTYSDLLTATASDDLYRAHPLQIVVREYDASLNHRLEFRGFVNEGQLTALSQYNHYCFFPEVARRKDALMKLLVEFWQSEVKHRVPVQSYVVDFGFLCKASSIEEGESPRIAVVELNPFASTTGGALFDWKADRDLLESGPLQCRVHTAPVQGLEEMAEFCVDNAVSGQEGRASPEWHDREGKANDSADLCSLM